MSETREEHKHCWHQWGVASGSVGTAGSSFRGTNRCCHCGEYFHYDETVKAAPPIQHGRFYAEILRWPS